MIYHVIPVIIVVVLILIGHFNNIFFDFVNDTFTTYRINSSKYNTVIMQVDKIQQELGMDGVLNSFYAPLHHMQGRNY